MYMCAPPLVHVCTQTFNRTMVEMFTMYMYHLYNVQGLLCTCMFYHRRCTVYVMHYHSHVVCYMHMYYHVYVHVQGHVHFIMGQAL